MFLATGYAATLAQSARAPFPVSIDEAASAFADAPGAKLPAVSAAIIQIFGTKKCQDTRKAERWFKERGMKVQTVDLSQKGLSPGELRSVAARVGGVEALIDRDGKRYVDKGLKYSAPTGPRIEALLLDDPLLLKTPIVRRGQEATLGYQPEVWERWK